MPSSTDPRSIALRGRRRIASGWPDLPLRSTVVLTLALLVLALRPSPAAAAARDGIDCGCTKTGAYATVSTGSAQKAPVDPVLIVTPSDPNTAESAKSGGKYTLTQASGAGQTTLTITLTGSSTTLLQLTFTVNGSESWGFSSDEDRFLFNFHNSGKPSGTDTIQLYDLSNLSSTSGPPVYETDLDGGWSAQFVPKSGRLVLSSSGGFNGPIFRVVDPSTGDVVFHQGFLSGGTATDTATDFDFLTTPFGFSPNGNYFLYHYVSGTPQHHYVRLYDLAPPAAAQTAVYDNAEGAGVLRFSSNSAYLLEAFTTGSSNTTLQIRETATGALAYSDSFSFVNNPGNVGDKFKGAAWGFSPKAGNLIYLVDAGPSAVDLNLVNLVSGQRVLQILAADVVSGFLKFSRCGDVLATVIQNGGGGLTTGLYSTNANPNGAALYSGTSILSVVWSFQSTATEHQVDVGGGGWQLMTSNQAGNTCTPPVPDTTPPVWDPGATLTAVEGAAQGDIDLAWAPAATDSDSGMALYRIYQDGGEIATVPDGTLAYSVTGLTSSTAYTFKVEAEDSATPTPNESADGPSTSITLPDFAPPSFAPGDALVANNIGPTSFDLAWPAASDDSGVSEYRIYRNGALFSTLGGAVITLAVSGLDWESDYHFEIEAADAAGNVSARLELDVTTAGPPTSAQPPAWPGGAVLTVSVTGPESIDLSWPAASGADGVSGYDILLSGRRIAQVPDPQTSFALAGLLPDMDWNFEIVPRNSWRQPGSALAGTGHTAPGTHVDPPIPVPLVSDVNGWSDIGRVSSSGRYVSFHSTDSNSPGFPSGFSEFLYDRVTAQVVGIEDSLVSGDGRHVVRPTFTYLPPPFQAYPDEYVNSISRDLDTSVETVLYDASWGSAPASASAVIGLDLSEAGDRLLIAVGIAIPGESYQRSHLMVAAGAAGVASIATLGRICANSHSLCESLAGAWLASDASSVVYWGESRSGSTAAWQPWIKSASVSGGGTRTLVQLSDRNVKVGPGSADASGIVVFETTEALLPQDSPRTGGPVIPRDLDVYAYDRVTRALELISVDSGGAALGGKSPSVSADGRYVAYEGGPCGSKVIAIRDRWLSSTRCVTAPGQFSTDTWNPILAANGRYLIFESDSVAEQGVHLVDLAWQPPAWPVPASIVMTGNDFTSIDFTWTPAEDRSQFPAALGTYEIYRDGAAEASLPFIDFLAGLPSYHSPGLRPATNYDFEIELLDASGTETTDGPQAVLQTRTPTADVSISIVDSPDPIGTATQVRYDITLSNAGPDMAFGAAFDFSWPAGFRFLAANPMAGSCGRPAPDSLSCVLGDVAAGDSVQVVVLLSTGAQGVADVSASASALGTDPVPGNSTGVQESTEVVPGGGGGLGGGGGAGMVGSVSRDAGSVVGWGDNASGKISPPAAVAQRTARVVAAGVTHSCAIQAETGAVLCWGSNTYDESVVPDEVNGTLGTAVELAAGNHYTCAIQAGTRAVVCWGLNGYGQAVPPTSVTGTSGGATAIAVGWNHSCAIRADNGGVVCWGVNGDRQRNVPSSVNGVSGTASAVAVGFYHSCAVQGESGNVLCWGARYNDYGQLAVPPEVDGTSGRASALEAGQRDTCAVQENTAKVYCWGANWFGVSPPPPSLGGASGTAHALAVADTACAIQTGTGAVVCWGGSATLPPSQVNGSAGTALAIAGSQSHFCAIQAGTHAVVCWGGSNSSGETDVPASVNGSGGLATAVAAGAHHSCAIAAASGAVVCWGATGGNDFGQTVVPPEINGTMGTASALALGALHSCAIQRASGEVFCWGSGADNRTLVPAEVNGSAGTARGIAAGGAHSCAIQDGTDTVICWGDGTLGQTGTPPEVDGTTGTANALAAGMAHSCAIQAETGDVICWGDDAFGRSTPPPAVDGTDGTASAIAAGDSHSCAIAASSGAVVCWGDDALGQATPPPGVDGSAGGAIAIAAGLNYSCAIQVGTHALICWGDTPSGQPTPPGPFDGESGEAIGLAAGELHGLALYVPEPDARLLALTALAGLGLLGQARRRRPSHTTARE